jgi:membrane protein
MSERLRSSILFKYIEQLIFRYKDDDLSGMSAQITYYLILAIFPFLIFLINLLSFTHLPTQILFADFNKFLPTETGDLVKNIVVQTLKTKSGTLLIVSMIGSLWAASKGISAIMKGLNKAYDVKESRKFIKLNTIALISTLEISIMIILSFAMIVFGKIIGTYIFGLVGATNLFVFAWSFLRYCIPIAIMFVTFSLIYGYIPNKKLKFNNIKIGAIFATIGWITTSLIFSFYVNNFGNYQNVYGSLGGVIGLISWLYISTLIILLGGELNSINGHFKNKENDEK